MKCSIDIFYLDLMTKTVLRQLNLYFTFRKVCQPHDNSYPVPPEN